jgi:uncharacterized protein YbjQ (UPF0145 family)
MFSNPLVVALLLAALAVTVLSVLARFFQSRKESARLRKRRDELRRQQGHLVMQQQELERLAGRILATSSTSLVAGFQIMRQIEAVVTDGHPSPNRAVETLKAMAAERGANAVINLGSERLASGKCVARGDAVIVRPIDAVGPA